MERVHFFRSLHFKIASGVIATVILITAAYFVTDYRSNRQRLLDDLQQSADQLASISLQGLLELAMLGRHPQLLQEAIERLAGNSSVERILLMDLDGVVRFSSDPEELGHRLEKGEPGCVNCHLSGSPQAGSAFIAMDGREFLRDVRLVPNRSQCHACHDSQNPHNGLLVIDFPTTAIWAQLRSDFYQTLGRSALSVVMILAVLGLLLNKWVIRPLQQLQLAAVEIEREEDRPSNLESGEDELGRLAHSFVAMRERVRTTLQKLQGQRAYLQHLINSLNEGLIVLDSEMQIEMTNQAAHRIWPREAVEVLLQTPELRAALQGTMSTGEMRSCELSLPGEGGEKQFVEIHCSPFHTASREVEKVILLIRDVTSRRQFQAQASRAERLASVGQLAAGLAHEINNPMAAITTCAEGLTRHVAGSTGIVEEEKEEIQEYLSTVAEAAMRCKAITQRLLSASAEEDRGDFQELDLDSVVRGALTLIEHQARHQRVELAFSGANGSSRLQGSRQKLSQLLLNLLLNSLEACREGARIEVQLESSRDNLNLVVSDTGCGIPEALLEKIFDPFFTTKTEVQGTGLGLSICQWIVRQHGGRISVESRVGEGTRFSILLPRTQDIAS